ncbi:HNH endonuclease family protein [Mycolicibacterium arenosum]|uniref:HNH endonuclease family protein n=1 Tax=Mycolicibacterium arenosum TaxID=2952157 RepID=A0ABT1M4L5_9MYCO|nr:HNH endonuclease family protein [Mycolicibacterium sp. CAU 1645]MCP9274105.1 HNH endonuclease family protein [Mycolicibacterium sp. CAU 1645]
MGSPLHALRWLACLAFACAACSSAAPSAERFFVTATPPSAQPVTTAPSPPTIAPSGEIGQLLTRIPVVPALPNVSGYDRSCSPGRGCVFGPAWKDVERTGCDTRNRVLADQLRRVEFKPGTGDCKVVSGLLDDPYSGTTIPFTSADPRAVEIDHVFALGRAWDAGAAAWPVDKRVLFANDTENLLAVSGDLNQSKSDSGPGTWLPPNASFACPFVMRYLRVAAKWQLRISADDRAVAMSTCA